MSVTIDTRWDLRAVDVYAAAMQCKTTPIEKWDMERMDFHPSGAVEFCDIVTPEILRDLDSVTIMEMCRGYCAVS